jgi:hypothetical protein
MLTISTDKPSDTTAELHVSVPIRTIIRLLYKTSKNQGRSVHTSFVRSLNYKSFITVIILIDSIFVIYRVLCFGKTVSY